MKVEKKIAKGCLKREECDEAMREQREDCNTDGMCLKDIKRNLCLAVMNLRLALVMPPRQNGVWINRSNKVFVPFQMSVSGENEGTRGKSKRGGKRTDKDKMRRRE